MDPTQFIPSNPPRSPGESSPLIERTLTAVDAIPRLPWFGIRVRSNYERVTTAHLRDRGFEEFAPTYRVETQWSDRKKIKEELLFPGYLFCRLNPQDRLPVLSTPGVVNIVGFGKEPCPIPDHEIENVRAMVESGLLVMPWPYLKQGQTVLIERGPLTGLEGILKEIKGRLRVVVSIELLQRSVSAEIDRTWVRPLTKPLVPAKGETGS